VRSASVICGGFMPLRGGPDDLTPFWPMINVTRVDGAKQDGLLTIAGPATGASARRLVSLATSEPRSRRLPIRASAKALDVYLALRGPRRRTGALFDGQSYLGGIVGPGRRSLALLAGWPTISVMRVYGGDEAADELEVVVAGWVESGRPGSEHVAISVSFRNGTSTIRTRWRGR